MLSCVVVASRDHAVLRSCGVESQLDQKGDELFQEFLEATTEWNTEAAANTAAEAQPEITTQQLKLS